MSPSLLFVVGASGAGKTAAVRTLEQRQLEAVHCHYFDSIGVPSPEEMARRWGGGERWQEDATRQWIERLRTAHDGAAAVSVLDGQTRPSFIRKHMPPGTCHRIVLLDCDPGTRASRLHERQQPELATARMDNWASYLRGEANALDLPVIDTSRLTIAAVADALLQEIAQLAKAAGP